MAISRLFLAILLSLCVSYVIGHSYVTSPTSRSNQKQTNAGCRGPNCLGPCDVPLNQARTPAVTIARGGSINVQWPRNNHAGGFIRFAWSKTSESDSHTSFDNNVQEIHCHEIGGCGPDDSANPNGGDSGPADGSSRACQVSINVPSYLEDGQWTLQWAWFGGAFALGDYYSCIDYVISGGQSGPKSNAFFFGGDFTYPGQNKCKFFNTDRLHKCVNEPCNNPVYTMYQEQAGPAFGLSASQSNGQPPQPLTSASKPVAPLTSGAKVVVPLTTGSKPLTSGAKPLTSGAKIVTPITSGSSRIGTTGSAPKPSTTGSPKPSTTGSVTKPSTANCAGMTHIVDPAFADLSIIAVDAWSNVFRMELVINVHSDLSDWMIQVIWPSEAVDTQIYDVLNAGELRCSATVPARHEMIQPVASWANQLKAGEQLIVELKAYNTNMDENFLKANTQIKLFRK